MNKVLFFVLLIVIPCFTYTFKGTEPPKEYFGQTIIENKIDIGISLSKYVSSLYSSKKSNSDSNKVADHIDLGDFAEVSNFPYGAGIYLLYRKMLKVHFEYQYSEYTVEPDKIFEYSKSIKSYKIKEDHFKFQIAFGYHMLYEEIGMYPYAKIGIGKYYYTDEFKLNPGYETIHPYANIFPDRSYNKLLNNGTSLLFSVGFESMFYQAFAAGIELGINGSLLEFKNKSIDNTYLNGASESSSIYLKLTLSYFYRLETF